jgi:hypothetical protein
LNKWLYYAPAAGSADHYSSGPRWFLNMTTLAWFTM